MPDLDRLVKIYLPMSEPSFLLLSSLLEERHGYGIMQYVEQITGGRVSLGAGTVYTILYKMENDGLIQVSREEERRKIYRITREGLAVLEAESRRILELSRIAAGNLEQMEAMTVG